MLGTDIQKAKALLDAGELVAIPTETVYGLAAKAVDEEAVLSIFKAKERPFFDPLICHFRDLNQVKDWLPTLPEKAILLAEKFWPGPLTMILPKSNKIPELVTSGLPMMGVRIPRHPLTSELLNLLDYPIAAPSANPFGYVSPTKATHVQDQLGNRISYILDGGDCAIGVESTIVSFKAPNQPKILRYGGISKEQLEEVVGPLELELNKSSNPEAPGQLKKHYSPKTKVVLKESWKPIEADRQKVAFLHFSKEAESGEHHYYLSERGDLDEAARNLFMLLRKLDDLGYDTIVAEEVPDQGLGKAINDRLGRAISQ